MSTITQIKNAVDQNVNHKIQTKNDIEAPKSPNKETHNSLLMIRNKRIRKRKKKKKIVEEEDINHLSYNNDDNCLNNNAEFFTNGDTKESEMNETTHETYHKRQKTFTSEKTIKTEKEKKEEKKNVTNGQYRSEYIKKVIQDAMEYFKERQTKQKTIDDLTEEENTTEQEEIEKRKKEKEKDKDKDKDKEKEKEKEKDKNKDKNKDNFNEINTSSLEECENENTKMCIICKTEESKYRCPYCERKYCSLKCSNIHKELYKCKKTLQNKFKNRKLGKTDFNEEEFYKDFSYLENVTKIVRRGYQYIKVLEHECASNIWKLNTNYLHRIFRTRGIKVYKSFPLGSLHKENDTYILKNVIYWKVGFKFVNCDFVITESNINEHSTFTDILNYISEKDSETKEKIHFYISNISCIHINLLQKEDKEIVKPIEKEKTKEVAKETTKKIEKKKTYVSANYSVRNALKKLKASFYEYPFFLLHIFYKNGEITQNEQYQKKNSTQYCENEREKKKKGFKNETEESDKNEIEKQVEEIVENEIEKHVEEIVENEMEKET